MMGESITGEVVSLALGSGGTILTLLLSGKLKIGRDSDALLKQANDAAAAQLRQVTEAAAAAVAEAKREAAEAKLAAKEWRDIALDAMRNTRAAAGTTDRAVGAVEGLARSAGQSGSTGQG